MVSFQKVFCNLSYHSRSAELCFGSFNIEQSSNNVCKKVASSCQGFQSNFLRYIFILIYVVFLIGRLYLLFFEKCLFLSPSFNRIKPKVVKSQLETSTSILSGFKINQSKVCIRFIFSRITMQNIQNLCPCLVDFASMIASKVGASGAEILNIGKS